MVSTTANRPPRTRHSPENGRQDRHTRQDGHPAGDAPHTDVLPAEEWAEHRQQPGSAPREHSDTENPPEDTDTGRVPHPRQDDSGCNGRDVPATLTVGPDGALWVTVDGADVHEVSAKIGAVCAVLNRTRPPR